MSEVIDACCKILSSESNLYEYIIKYFLLDFETITTMISNSKKLKLENLKKFPRISIKIECYRINNNGSFNIYFVPFEDNSIILKKFEIYHIQIMQALISKQKFLNYKHEIDNNKIIYELCEFDDILNKKLYDTFIIQDFFICSFLWINQKLQNTFSEYYICDIKKILEYFKESISKKTMKNLNTEYDFFFICKNICFQLEYIL